MLARSTARVTVLKPAGLKCNSSTRQQHHRQAVTALCTCYARRATKGKGYTIPTRLLKQKRPSPAADEAARHPSGVCCLSRGSQTTSTALGCPRTTLSKYALPKHLFGWQMISRSELDLKCRCCTPASATTPCLQLDHAVHCLCNAANKSLQRKLCRAVVDLTVTGMLTKSCHTPAASLGSEQ